MTVGAYAVDWLRDTALTVRPSTADFYRYALVHVEPLRGVPLASLTPAHVRALIAGMAADGQAAMARRTVQTLSQMLKRALEDGLVDRNVASLVRLPKVEPKAPEHFTAEQARRFLDAARTDPLGGLYAVALGTGLRRGELLGLQWSDVDTHAGTVRVRRGKTAASARLVPLPSFAQAALAQNAVGADDDVHAARGGGTLRRARVGPIWTASPSYVSNHFKDLCRQAGVPVLTMHSTRHTAASLMLDEGVPIEVIRQIIGHTKISMTGHYARSGEALQRDAVEKLGRAVG